MPTPHPTIHSTLNDSPAAGAQLATERPPSILPAGEPRRVRLPTVGVLVRSSRDRTEIARQLADVAAVESLDGLDTLVARVHAGGLRAVIAEAHDERGAVVTPLVIALAGRRPVVPLILYDRADRRVVDALLSLLVPGLVAEYVVRPAEPLAPAVRRALATPLPHTPSAGPILLHELMALAPAPLRIFVAVVALKAQTGRGVDQLARWSGLSGRTVERRLHEAGWAIAHELLQSVRALDAVWLMSELGWSARQVQRARGITHASTITRLLQRYAGGLTPTAVRQGDGFDGVLDTVLRRITRRTLHT